MSPQIRESVGRILVVDDEPSILSVVHTLVKAEGYEVTGALGGERALELLGRERFDVVMTDIRMVPVNGFEVLRAVKEHCPDTEVLMLTAYGTLETAVEALKLGAFDYLTKPFKIPELLLTIQRALEYRRTAASRQDSQTAVVPEYALEGIVAASMAMRGVCDMVTRVAPTDTTVLISGESGTGKELIATSIHSHSLRKEKRFLAVNCAALSEPLLESELFGHLKGSFSGAASDKEGLFEAANGGTVFLDEVDAVPLSIQEELLRVLQEKEIRRVGGNENIPVDVRVLAATSCDLRSLIDEGTFREDLYYRLSIIPIQLKPLRERRADILPLVYHFIVQDCGEGQEPVTLSAEASAILQAHDWPANARELSEAIAGALRSAKGNMIARHDLPPELAARDVPEAGPEEGPASYRGTSLRAFLRAKEGEYLKQVLGKLGGDKEKAAEVLNISLATLYRKLDQFGVHDDEPQPRPAAERGARGSADRRAEDAESESEGSADVQADRTSTAGAEVYPYLVGGLVHDSLNTIGALRGHMEQFQRRNPEAVDPALTKLLRRAARSAEHLEKILRVVQLVAREYYKTDKAAAAGPVERFEEIVAGFREKHPAIAYECSMDPSCEDTELPFGAVTFLAGELLQNASNACAGTQDARVCLNVARSEDGELLSIECRDSGPGFPPPILEGILDGSIRAPRKPGAGGYGLYLMLQIVQRLEGATMLASNLDPSGARLELLLPFEGGVA